MSPARVVRVCVVGGGINGVMAAAALRERGMEVELHDASTIMSRTSSASTKLLHGGLRYLEHGAIRLVREALSERAWWLRQAPHLCHPIRLLLPVWVARGRTRWKLRVGLGLYDLLAGQARIEPHRWLPREVALQEAPHLRAEGLCGAFAFWDGQMDDLELGRWAAERARFAGVRFHEHSPVTRVAANGEVEFIDGLRRFDCVANVAGPWAGQLLERSGIESRHRLDLVRGSHLVLSRPCPSALLAEVEGERRIAFVLPWKGGTMVGTTEVRQSLSEPIVCSTGEREYLLRFCRQVMSCPIVESDVASTFAGVRPLIRSADDPSRASREYEIECRGRLVTVFGGKWTTARVLGLRVADAVQRQMARCS